VDSFLNPVEIHEAVMALHPDEREDRAKVNAAVREGPRPWPAASCRERGLLWRSEGDGIIASKQKPAGVTGGWGS
jgi:hypothetical protein